MPLPVKRSINPKLNAPLWATTLVGAFTAIYAAVSSTGIKGGQAIVVAVVLVLAGLASQVFTRPNRKVQ